MAVLQTKEQTERSPFGSRTWPRTNRRSVTHQRSRFHHTLTAAILSLSAWGVTLAFPNQRGQASQTESPIVLATQPPALHDPASRPVAAADSFDQGIFLAQTKSPGSSSLSREPSEPEAPSVLWLIAMPAIPILGGAFIYIRRRWSGRQVVETRSLPQSPAEEPTSCKPMTSQPTDLETDSLRD